MTDETYDDDNPEPDAPPRITQIEYLKCLLELYQEADVREAMRECGDNAAAASNWLRVMGVERK